MGSSEDVLTGGSGGIPESEQQARAAHVPSACVLPTTTVAML
jgi:hypothetical protein